ncbi:MAG: arginine--tRNA ligase, partial [Bacilli bacterium]|nr:arginine--tRNA ligase [Bacilli bacterium]
MTNEEKLKSLIALAGKSLGLPLEEKDVVIEHSKDPAHGDYSTNVAMRFCKAAGCAPRDLAAKFIAAI